MALQVLRICLKKSAKIHVMLPIAKRFEVSPIVFKELPIIVLVRQLSVHIACIHDLYYYGGKGTEDIRT